MPEEAKLDTPLQARLPDSASSTTEPAPPGPCTKCGTGIGWTEGGLCGECDWYRRRDAAIQEKRRKESSAAWSELVASIGGESELPKYTLNAFQPYDSRTASAAEVVKAFHPASGNLYLTGVPGCGKTHLAIGLAQKFFADGKTISYFPSGPAFARHFQMREPDEEERRIKVVSNCDLLVINEAWIGNITAFRMEKLHEVLDAREMLGRRGIVITSNLHPADLEEQTKDSRLRSRFEGPAWKIVLAGDRDYRAIQRERRGG